MPVQRLSKDLLRRHHVLVASDNSFQQRARLLQALWREAQGLPIGAQRGQPLGSRIETRVAREGLGNFMTPVIRDVVEHAVFGAGRAAGQLIDEARLCENLLSSQPLCFNLFGELARDLDLATRVLARLAPDVVGRVESITFEHSPGRGDPRFTGDRSAFDVFVVYRSPVARRGFLGIEVKYHEGLGDPAADHRARYDEVADTMACFAANRDALRRPPLQQIWRDHLLSGALVAAKDGFDEGSFVFLYPRDNATCARAVAAYREHLVLGTTFRVWLLEDVVDAMRAGGAVPLAHALGARYVAFDSLTTTPDGRPQR